MPHRPALHLAELAALWDAEPTPVVLSLLWEIHRLQATIRRAQQVREMIRSRPGSVPDIVWLAFEKELDAEPCLTDGQTERQRKKIERWMARSEAERESKRKSEKPKEVDPALGPMGKFFAEGK
jgi:hypothetical protein